MEKPKNWPEDKVYLVAPSHSKLLSPAQLAAIRTRPPAAPALTRDQTPSPCLLVKIATINAASHPAAGQRGLFAARHLSPGSAVLPYLGVVHGEAVSLAESDYDVALDRAEGVAVDAARAGNEARFVNDYRGVRDRPNAEFREAWCERFGERCVAVFVLPAGKKGRGKDGIAKGEEILVSYGKGFWSHRREEDRLGEASGE